MAATTIPEPTATTIAGQVARLYPNRWAGDAAKSPGGVMYSLFLAVGSQVSFALQQANYALSATRIQTETSPELDLASEDFFGNALPRAAGQTDAAFLALIQANLFVPQATRGALSTAIENLVGAVPRMIEPWNPGDTGARDTLVSYRDVDNASNPMLNTSGYLGYNGFIITQLPIYNTIGANPLYTRDDGAYRDANEYRLTVQASTLTQLYALINRVRAFGTVVWVKLTPQVAGGSTPTPLLSDSGSAILSDSGQSISVV